jgi:hypothetical protein
MLWYCFDKMNVIGIKMKTYSFSVKASSNSIIIGQITGKWKNPSWYSSAPKQEIDAVLYKCRCKYRILSVLLSKLIEVGQPTWEISEQCS